MELCNAGREATNPPQILNFFRRVLGTAGSERPAAPRPPATPSSTPCAECGTPVWCVRAGLGVVHARCSCAHWLLPKRLRTWAWQAGWLVGRDLHGRGIGSREVRLAAQQRVPHPRELFTFEGADAATADLFADMRHAFDLVVAEAALESWVEQQAILTP